MGKIGEFQPLVEDWMQYAERLEFSSQLMTSRQPKRNAQHF